MEIHLKLSEIVADISDNIKSNLMGGGEEESIEAAATARKERLRALKAAQELLNTPDDDTLTDKPVSANNHQSQEQLEQEKEDEDDNEDEEEP